MDRWSAGDLAREGLANASGFYYLSDFKTSGQSSSSSPSTMRKARFAALIEPSPVAGL
jgi:hypothetical protein